MDLFENGEGFTVNYDKLINSKDYLAVTRKLAIDLMSKP